MKIVNIYILFDFALGNYKKQIIIFVLEMVHFPKADGMPHKYVVLSDFR